MRSHLFFLAYGFFLFAPGLAQAYIGPGAGLSAVGSVIALLGALFLLLLGFLWYPIKRLIRHNRHKAYRQADDSES